MRILLIRFGAWGDSIIITPLIRYLHEQGNEIVVNTSETGMKILAGNPYIAKFAPYKSNSVPDDKLDQYWKDLAKQEGCEKIINMCESIERALSPHPMDPLYNFPKDERAEVCDKNFYEYAFKHAGYDQDVIGYGQGLEKFRGEMFFTPQEERGIEEFFNSLDGKFVILWGLSGSSLNKTYPWTDNIIGDLLKIHKDLVVVTVGDEMGRVLEVGEHARVIRMCGKWTMRESSLATKYASLVVSPDTGLLHAAGMWDTPKIGLIGSNTINNITKHFINDYSIQADEEAIPCAPCFRIIYRASVQCPIEEGVHLPRCMVRGIDPKKVLERIEHVKSIFAGSAMPSVPAPSRGAVHHASA